MFCQTLWNSWLHEQTLTSKNGLCYKESVLWWWSYHNYSDFLCEFVTLHLNPVCGLCDLCGKLWVLDDWESVYLCLEWKNILQHVFIVDCVNMHVVFRIDRGWRLRPSPCNWSVNGNPQKPPFQLLLFCPAGWMYANRYTLSRTQFGENTGALAHMRNERKNWFKGLMYYF